jgi:hypothetical protein
MVNQHHNQIKPEPISIAEPLTLKQLLMFLVVIEKSQEMLKVMMDASDLEHSSPTERKCLFQITHPGFGFTRVG